MKKSHLLLALFLLATPSLVRADDHDGRDGDDRKRHVHATEMTSIGIGGAALLGVVGYMILRKRNTSA